MIHKSILLILAISLPLYAMSDNIYMTIGWMGFYFFIYVLVPLSFIAMLVWLYKFSQKATHKQAVITTLLLIYLIFEGEMIWFVPYTLMTLFTLHQAIWKRSHFYLINAFVLIMVLIVFDCVNTLFVLVSISLIILCILGIWRFIETTNIYYLMATLPLIFWWYSLGYIIYWDFYGWYAWIENFLTFLR